MTKCECKQFLEKLYEAMPLWWDYNVGLISLPSYFVLPVLSALYVRSISPRFMWGSAFIYLFIFCRLVFLSTTRWRWETSSLSHTHGQCCSPTPACSGAPGVPLHIAPHSHPLLSILTLFTCHTDELSSTFSHYSRMLNRCAVALWSLRQSCNLRLKVWHQDASGRTFGIQELPYISCKFACCSDP